MPPDASSLGAALSAALSEPVAVALAWESLEASALRPGERALAEAFGPERRQDFTRGRAALKALLRAAGQDEDTSRLRFPHARFSLSHTRRLAVAVGLPSSQAAGIGVDLEHDRVVPPGAERFYLDEGEQAWLAAQPEAARASVRLRLWTVKEALFKAHLGNAGTVVSDYRVEDPAAGAGRASLRGRSAWPWRYATLTLAEGVLTVASRVDPC
jgi:4'-phosphopantetheinyl transferase EntD